MVKPEIDPNHHRKNQHELTGGEHGCAVHYVLEHRDTAGNYARIIFVDFSSAFNTIIPHTLERQLPLLQVPVSTCKWITEFLTNRGRGIGMSLTLGGTHILTETWQIRKWFEQICHKLTTLQNIHKYVLFY